MLLNTRTPIEQLDVTGDYAFTKRLMTLDGFRNIAVEAGPDLKAPIQSVDLAKITRQLAISWRDRHGGDRLKVVGQHIAVFFRSRNRSTDPMLSPRFCRASNATTGYALLTTFPQHQGSHREHSFISSHRRTSVTRKGLQNQRAGRRF
jgi:hypothetical protein